MTEGGHLTDAIWDSNADGWGSGGNAPGSCSNGWGSSGGSWGGGAQGYGQQSGYPRPSPAYHGFVDPGIAGAENNSEKLRHSSNTKAFWALGLGLVALFLPVPFLDLAAGIFGIVLAARARRESPGSLSIAAMIVAIIGTVIAAIYTLTALFGLMVFGGLLSLLPWLAVWT